MARESCGSCRYGKQDPIDPKNIGADRPVSCMRYPPSVFPVGMNSDGPVWVAGFPRLSPEIGWCGEWAGALNG